MNTSQARKLADQAVDQLAAALEQGQSESLTRYLVMLARFPTYSFGNVMLIHAQRPDATYVAGFNTWKKFGRFVKKGEKGIAILAPMVIRRRDVKLPDDENEMPNIFGFRAVFVFDHVQTDGKPLPELGRVGGDPQCHTERLKQFVASQGIQLRYSADIGGADGASSGGCITLRPGLAPADEFAVLVHELAHESLHSTGKRGATSKIVRETEAEAVAFVVSQAVGLETGTASADYIQLHAGDSRVLAESLERIQRTAAEVIAAITADDQRR